MTKHTHCAKITDLLPWVFSFANMTGILEIGCPYTRSLNYKIKTKMSDVKPSIKTKVEEKRPFLKDMKGPTD